LLLFIETTFHDISRKQQQFTSPKSLVKHQQKSHEG